MINCVVQGQKKLFFLTVIMAPHGFHSSLWSLFTVLKEGGSSLLGYGRFSVYHCDVIGKETDCGLKELKETFDLLLYSSNCLF